jgi:hypothetical protein
MSWTSCHKKSKNRVSYVCIRASELLNENKAKTSREAFIIANKEVRDHKLKW